MTQDPQTPTASAPAPSETSPLLPKLPRRHSSQHPIDPSAGLAPEGADPYISSSEDYNSEDDERDGGDIERQPSNGETSKHRGLPEVKKKMKWIFPAIAIGVFLAAADQTLVVSTYGTIGTDLKALNNTSWIATAYVILQPYSHSHILSFDGIEDWANRGLLQLLPYPVSFPTRLRQAQRHFRTERMSALRIHHIWTRFSLVRSGPEHWRTHCRTRICWNWGRGHDDSR